MSVNDINADSLIKEVGLSKNTETNKDRTKPGQAEFLDLMVAQLKNQDPSISLENGGFIAQMAHLGATTGLDKLQNSLQSNQALQASTLVGRSVLVPSSQAVLALQGTVKGILDLPQSAPNTSISILDASGQLVKNIEIGGHAAGEVPFVWDGTNNAGERMPPGRYQLAAEGQGTDGWFSVGTLVTTSVESVTIGNGGQKLTLNLQDMGQVDFSQVREIK